MARLSTEDHGSDGQLSDKSQSSLDARLVSGATRAPNRFVPQTQHVLISVAAATIMLLFGYEQGIMGGILVGDEFQRYFNHPTPAITGFVTSVYDLGCFAGALLTLVVGEWLGRKRMLIVFTLIMTAGILVQAGAQSIKHLVIGRFIAGLGNGGNTATAPVWHVETATTAAKGKAVVQDMTANVFGFVLSNIFTLFFSKSTSDVQWRVPLGIQLIFPTIILVLVPLLPESPRWLLARGRDSDALNAFTSLSLDPIGPQFKELRRSVREEMSVQANWAQVFRGGIRARRLCLGMSLQIMQQLSGINLYCYFLPYVLKLSVGLPDQAARWVATLIAMLYTIATGLSFYLVDRLGRRRLLMWLSGGLAIACIGVAISSGIESVPGVVAVGFMTLYFIAFGFGWVAVPWLYPAEVNSLSMRTKGAGLSTSCNWIFNWLVVSTTPVGIHYLHWGIYLIYAALNACFIPLIYYFVVETANLSLEEIDRWFVANPEWRVDKAEPFVLDAVRHESILEERFGLVGSDNESNDYDGDASEISSTDGR